VNIDVEFKEIKLSLKEFKASPLESNLIEINGKSLGTWLNTKTGKANAAIYVDLMTAGQ